MNPSKEKRLSSSTLGSRSSLSSYDTPQISKHELKAFHDKLHRSAQRIETIGRDLRECMTEFSTLTAHFASLMNENYHKPSVNSGHATRTDTSLHTPNSTTPGSLLEPKKYETQNLRDFRNLINEIKSNNRHNEARAKSNSLLQNGPSTQEPTPDLTYSEKSNDCDSDDCNTNDNQGLGVQLPQTHTGTPMSTPDTCEFPPLSNNTAPLWRIKRQYQQQEPRHENSDSTLTPMASTTHEHSPAIAGSGVNEFTNPGQVTVLDFKQQLKDRIIQDKFFIPAMNLEYNFVGLFLRQMNKVNNYARRHMPETLMYSSKPRRVYDFLRSITRNWLQKANEVESLKREAPIIWEVFGTSLHNAQMIPKNFQVINPIIQEGVPITAEHFIQFVNLLRNRRDYIANNAV